MVPINYHSYDPAAIKLTKISKDARDVPLRAQSVSLSERPRSKYSRTIRSAGYRTRVPEKQYIHEPLPKPKPRQYKKVLVKPQNRKVIEKVPCAISVQTISIPNKYADHKHSTSKHLCNTNIERTKSSNPSKQVSDNKRLCEAATCGKETENKLLLQICEAKQVSDFERILNSNAIQCGSAHRYVWRNVAPVSSAAVLPRPRSAYSLEAVSHTYHELFHQHQQSLRPLIEQYREAAADDHSSGPPVSVLQQDWFENLKDLSEFYEDDRELHEEIENITDKIVAEEVKAFESEGPLPAKNNNFNVNLTDLLGLRVNGEGFSPTAQDDPSPDIEKVENEAEDKEWGLIMNAHSDDASRNEQNDSVDNLAQNLDSVRIDSDARVPTITFSNCCDARGKTDTADNRAVDVYLAVPSIDSDEARPPM